MHICILLPFCFYAGSSMEFQCFEIQIKTEADSNDCPQDNKPFTGMLAVSDEQDFVLYTAFPFTFQLFDFIFRPNLHRQTANAPIRC